MTNPQPNLAGSLRLGYIFVGAALIAWGVFYADPGTTRLIGCIIGAVAFIEGLIGYCAAYAILGLGGKKQGENLPR
jgi:hypothetical protein